MFDSGFLTVARPKGVPIRFHWSLPLGAVLFSRMAFVPGFWLGFLVLILGHELGHAMLVMAFRQRVLSVDVHGFGGLTRWTGLVTPAQRALIAWGGILAQGVLLLGAYGAELAFGAPATAFSAELFSALTYTNMYVMALNLIPIPPFDGAEAWQIFRVLGSGRRR